MEWPEISNVLFLCNHVVLHHKQSSHTSGLPLFFQLETLGVLGEFRRKMKLFLGDI